MARQRALKKKIMSPRERDEFYKDKFQVGQVIRWPHYWWKTADICDHGREYEDALVVKVGEQTSDRPGRGMIPAVKVFWFCDRSITWEYSENFNEIVS